MGLEMAKLPKVNDDFLVSLKGKELIADIRKEEIREKGEDGKYVGRGDFKNTLSNFKEAK